MDFAAVTAQSSRVFKLYEKLFPGLADSCKMASLKAWKWALENPDLQYDQGEMNKRYKPEVSTGGYADRTMRDEWL